MNSGSHNHYHLDVGHSCHTAHSSGGWWRSLPQNCQDGFAANGRSRQVISSAKLTYLVAITSKGKLVPSWPCLPVHYDISLTMTIVLLD